MAKENIYNDDDSMDINNELAALSAMNDDFSPEMLEELQKKIQSQMGGITEEITPKQEFNENDDTTLFEEPVQETADIEQALAGLAETPQIDVAPAEMSQEEVKKENIAAEPKKISKDFDDNFIKKYKAKLNRQKFPGTEDYVEEKPPEQPIEELSEGKITETKYTAEQKEYTEKLDFLDGNVKYSKYVIYVDPENVEFIESLTVKERKNLINKILREQDDILITKQNFGKLQTIIRHIIIAVLTISISIPIIYLTLNASIEATIDNYRRSQINFQTLYKSHGKISNQH